LPDETTVNTHTSISYLASNLSVGFDWLSNNHPLDGFGSPTSKSICFDTYRCPTGRLSIGAESFEGLSKVLRGSQVKLEAPDQNIIPIKHWGNQQLYFF
jgi:hypothetical protein